MRIVVELYPLHTAPNQNHNYPSFAAGMLHFLPSEDLSNRLLLHCMKSTKKKTFACNSEIRKELK